MKNNLHANPFVFKMIVLFTCFMLVIIYNKSKAAETVPGFSEKKVAVKFKHDNQKQELLVTVTSENVASLQLFIFSPDGELVTETNVNSLAPTTIKNVKRGFYTYECFNKDTRMKQGSFILK